MYKIVALCTSGSDLGGFEADSALAGLLSLILAELTFGTVVTPHQLKGQFSDEPPQYFKASDISLDEKEFRVLANASTHISGSQVS